MTEIVRTDGILGGDPRLSGHRISVLRVVDMVLEADRSPEYVADQFGISLADVHATLSYYYDIPGEMESIRDRHERREETLDQRAVAPDHVEQSRMARLAFCADEHVPHAFVTALSSNGFSVSEAIVGRDAEPVDVPTEQSFRRTYVTCRLMPTTGGNAVPAGT